MLPAKSLFFHLSLISACQSNYAFYLDCIHSHATADNNNWNDVKKQLSAKFICRTIQQKYRGIINNGKSYIITICKISICSHNLVNGMFSHLL